MAILGIYTGIDIGDYNQTKPNLADYYIVTATESFSEKISEFKECFDAVISTHNIEHCNNREKTIDAMLDAIKLGGQLYISFPCEDSINFPSRSGTLNYFDDPTHKDLPPDFDNIIRKIKSKGFKIEFAIKKYKPFVWGVLGVLNERKSRKQNKIVYSTWAYYGFESIIQAKKNS